jgi:hypothetical protein
MKPTFISVIIFCFFSVVLSFTLSAQEYKYNISKYYTPDIVRNQLDVSFGANSNFNNSTSRNGYTVSNIIKDSVVSSYNNSFYGTITPNFVTYTNTRKLSSMLQINGNFYGNYGTNGNFDQNDKNTTFITNDNLNVNYTSRFYNVSNQYFLLGISSNLQASVNKNNSLTNSITSNSFNNNYIINIAPSIGIGIGRIEQVEDARQAIYILDDLSKKKVLTRQLDNAEIFQFAQQISRVKNKRFLDSRLHLIDEINSVDSFLVKNNLLEKSDARYFTTLYDDWQYGALYSRKSGQSFEISISPSLNWNELNYHPVDTLAQDIENQNSLYGGLTFTYTYEKPVNLNWQHSLSASLNGFLSSNTIRTQYGKSTTATSNKTDDNGAKLSVNYTLGYYPSTRSYFTAAFSQNSQLDYVKYYNNSYLNSGKTFTSNSNIRLSAYYYFSPQ